MRLAVAFPLLYVAFGFWKNPDAWLGYIPSFVQSFGVPQNILLTAIMTVHVILALWILSGWRLFFSALIAAVFFTSIVYFNLNQLDVLFRDIALALAALALAVGSRNR